MPLPFGLLVALVLVSICLVAALILVATLNAPTTRTFISKWVGITFSIVACVFFVAVAVWSHPTSDQPLAFNGGVQTAFGTIAQLRSENTAVKETIVQERRKFTAVNQRANELLARAETAERQKQQAEREFAASLSKLRTDFTTKQQEAERHFAASLAELQTEIANGQNTVQQQLARISDAFTDIGRDDVPAYPLARDGGVAPIAEESRV